MRITESQLRQIVKEQMGFDRYGMMGMPPRRWSDVAAAEGAGLTNPKDTGLTNPNGTRSQLGNLLAKIAAAGRAGLEVGRKEVEPLIYSRYVVYGLHPSGGYRATITGEGRDALANI